MIYNDHWILISYRAFSWLYGCNIWNCDKGVPAQIEHNSFKSQICSEVHLRFSPVVTCHIKAQPLIFKWHLPMSTEEIILSSFYCGAWCFSTMDRSPQTATHWQGKQAAGSIPSPAFRTCLCCARTPMGGSAWNWVPHFWSDLGCRFTCNERNMDIHVHHQRKFLPNSLHLHGCVCPWCLFILFLQDKSQWPTLHCGDEVVKLALIIGSKKCTLPIHSHCSLHVCAADRSLTTAGRWQLSDTKEGLKENECPPFLLQENLWIPFPPWNQADTFIHSTERTYIVRVYVKTTVTH